jgi:hypothetical protein
MKSRRLNLLVAILALTVVYLAFTSREHMSFSSKDDFFLMKEGQPDGGLRIPLPTDVTIKYGADTRWVKKDFKKGYMFRCDNNEFGNDPAYGTSKSCYTVAPQIEKPAQPPSETIQVVNKNGTFVKKGGDDIAAVEPGCVFVSRSSLSLDACKSACLSDPACTNINYHVPTGGCQFRRCNNPSDPVGSKYSGWNMYAFIASNPMDPTGAMTSFAAKMKGIGEVASERGSSAFSSASELLGSTVSSFGYILSVVAIIVIGVIIAAVAWKMFMGSSSASTINSAPTIISR